MWVDKDGGGVGGEGPRMGGGVKWERKRRERLGRGGKDWEGGEWKDWEEGRTRRREGLRGGRED